MVNKKRIVLKFGGSVIHGQADFGSIASEIQRFVSDDFQLVVVVSAYFGVTERLMAEASEKCLSKESPAFSAYVSQGEFDAAKDLTGYLISKGLSASLSSPAQLEFIAKGNRWSSSPHSINANKINHLFETCSVIVLPGFSAIDKFGDSVLLGRGGSDISAVVVAQSLSLSRVRLLKDVDGIYDLDPNEHANAQRLEYVDYEHACEIGSVLIQPEAIKFAASKNVFIEIAAIGNSFVSIIGPAEVIPQFNAA
jgi:homoserine dehydrogenase